MFEIIQQIIGFLRSNYKTKKGFLAFFTLPLIAIILPFSPLNSLTTEQKIYAAAPIVFLHAIVWIIKSGVLIIPTSKTVIAFAVEADSKAYYNLKSIIRHLNNQLRDMGLLSNFSIKHIGYDRFKQEIPNAHKYRDSRGINLLIWGNAQNLKDKAKEVTPFKLYFTFPTGIINQEQLKLLGLDVGLFLYDKKWLIYDEDSYTYTITVTDDLLEVSLFILSISALLTQKIEMGILLLERVKFLLEARVQKNELINAKIGRINAILLAALWNLFGKICLRREIQKEFKLIERIIRIDPKSFPAHIEMARIQYLLGNKNASKEWNKKAYFLNKRHPLLFFNFAFFGILEKKYDTVTRFYNKIALRKFIDTNFPSIIEFLGECYDREKEEHAYLFCMGVVNLFHMDHAKGIKELRQFIKLAEGDQYKKMRDKAIEFLMRYKETENKKRREEKLRKRKQKKKKSRKKRKK